MEIAVNGIELFYEKIGEGKPIVLAHGNGESHEIFKETVALLKGNFCVYAVDTRGHGHSSSVDNLNYQDMANDFVEFIKILEIDKPIFYGFSDGGIIGLLIASQHPNLLEKLIISGANTKPQGIKLRWLLLLKAMHLFSRNKMLKLMIEQPNITDEDLQKISIPTLVLVGEKDLIKPSHTRNIASKIKNSELLIIKGEHHGSYIVHSPKLFAIIKPFITNKADN